MIDSSLHRKQPNNIMLAAKFALREMRGGLAGFLIFITCIALGVAAIAGVNSVSKSITTAVESQGQELLAGDIRFTLTQREVSSEESSWLHSLGKVSESATMRSMVRLADGSDQALVEVKAVDSVYPLYGVLDVLPALENNHLFDTQDGVHGAVVATHLLERLGLGLGDQILLGRGTFEIRAALVNEPDAVSEGFGFAPRFMLSLEGLQASGLVQPGSLVQHSYRIMLDKNTPAEVRNIAQTRFPDAGWNVRTRDNVSPGLSSNIERFSQFLTLVGLTVLVVGGVGVANAVRSYLDTKRAVIATFKSLGASGKLIVTVYLIQVVLIALIGIITGLALGALIPIIARDALQKALLIKTDAGFYPSALAIAAVFGILTTLAFALIPLGRARDIPVTALFRDFTFNGRKLPNIAHLLAAVITAIALALLAIFVSDDRRIAVIFIGAVILAFLILLAVGWAVQALARNAPRVNSTALRLAIGNIHRPGALTRSVVLSLGLGLTLLATLSMIDGNLRRQISANLPQVAPNFFFIDIQPQEVDQFKDLISKELPAGELVLVPMLRGKIAELNGVDIREITIPAEGGWVLRGDRGITYSQTVPENSTLVEGIWWDTDYNGEPLVSFSAEEAGQLGLKVGDTITVNVLGRMITAKIASLRKVEWETLALNFVMVFSPNTFAGAPHAWLATLTDTNANASDDNRILKAVTLDFPTVTSVGVKDALNAVSDLVGQLSTGIRLAASIALVASVLVLSGALAASNNARVRDSVILKTLGATRGTLFKAFAYEYLLLGLATSIFALIASSISAWFVIVKIMKLPWIFLPDVALITVSVALVLTVIFGLIGTWRVLGQKAAPILRNL